MLSLAVGAVVGALTVSVVVVDDADISLALGISATVVGGIAIPIVAAGGASARKGGAAQGLSGLRMTGWILYGLALADAVVLIGLGLGDAPAPAPVAGSVGLLGVASSIALGLDARRSADEAEASSLRPSVGIATDRDERATPTLGLVFAW